MSTSDDQQTPEELGTALVEALKKIPFEKQRHNERLRIGQQILPIDRLREMDADETQAERLLAVASLAGEQFDLFYVLALFALTEEAGLEGFLYQKAGKEAAFVKLLMPVKWILEGKDVSKSAELIEDGLSTARAVGAVECEAIGLLALGFCWYHAHQRTAEVVGALHDGLLLVPRAEAEIQAEGKYVLPQLKQLADMAARTLLKLLISSEG